MFFKNFFSRKQPRRFSYTPHYYTPDEQGDEVGGSRIRFRKIRSGSNISSKSIKSMMMLVVLVLFFLAYFWGYLGWHQTYDIDSIRIEEISQ